MEEESRKMIAAMIRQGPSAESLLVGDGKVIALIRDVAAYRVSAESARNKLQTELSRRTAISDGKKPENQNRKMAKYFRDVKTPVLQLGDKILSFAQYVDDYANKYPTRQGLLNLIGGLSEVLREDVPELLSSALNKLEEIERTVK